MVTWKIGFCKSKIAENVDAQGGCGDECAFRSGCVVCPLSFPHLPTKVAFPTQNSYCWVLKGKCIYNVRKINYQIVDWVLTRLPFQLCCTVLLLRQWFLPFKGTHILRSMNQAKFVEMLLMCVLDELS